MTDLSSPMTSELLRAHPTYQRAQTVLESWYTDRLNRGPRQLTAWRQRCLDTLDLISHKEVAPPNADWYWATERKLTIDRMLFALLRCAYHEEAEVRLNAWRELRKIVELWDEKFANDLDVA